MRQRNLTRSNRLPAAFSYRSPRHRLAIARVHAKRQTDLKLPSRDQAPDPAGHVIPEPPVLARSGSRTALSGSRARELLN